MFSLIKLIEWKFGSDFVTVNNLVYIISSGKNAIWFKCYR